MPSCTPLEVTDDMQALQIVAGDVTCCGETSAVVGVFYDGTWYYDGIITHDSQVA